MPMLAAMNTSWPPRWKGAANAPWIRSATLTASPGVLDAVEQDRELVAPEPGDGVLAARRATTVRGAQAPLQPARERDQQLIPDEVAEAVVDHLETVEVQEQDGEPGFRVPPRPLDRPLDAIQ